MVQMRALNTPQFDSTRNRVSQRPQPMPPIFESEITAIVYAAYSRRREVWVGGSTAEAIVANKFFPGLLDRYVAKNGYLGRPGGSGIRIPLGPPIRVARQTRGVRSGIGTERRCSAVRKEFRC
jgi:hypothetical protein